MGSATTRALAASKAALGTTTGLNLVVAQELFTAARALGDSKKLAGALADAAATQEARAKVVTAVFGPSFSAAAVAVLSAASQQRWSTRAEFVDAIEELAIRTAAIAAGDADLEGELFSVLRTVADNPELELALGARTGDANEKGGLVSTLLDGRVSEATALIVSSIVRQKGGRRARPLLERAISIAADQQGRIFAMVVSAQALTAPQIARLSDALQKRYSSAVSINTLIDPSVVGGLRVQIADDVIDASISARLAELRQRIAG